MKLKISEEQSLIEISPNSYFWFGDAFENFPNEKIFNLNIKLDKNKDFTSSILVKPDSIDSESKCLIVKGKRHECLYVKRSEVVLVEQFLDPITGKIELKSDENNNEFEILLFASRYINEISIPSNIKIISIGAFLSC